MCATRNISHPWNTSQISILKAIGRSAALVLLLLSMLLPWIVDTHPSTEARCRPPMVYVGYGYCACLITIDDVFWMWIQSDQVIYLLFFLLPALPILSTPLLYLGRGRRFLWIFHRVAWGLTAVFALFLFIGHWAGNNGTLKLWGAGFAGAVAVVALAGELLAARLKPGRMISQ